MEKIKEYDVKLPDWSLPYLINGDASGLTEVEIKQIESAFVQVKFEAEQINGFYDVWINDAEQEAYFSNSPAFGLPCNVVDAKIVIIKR